LFSTEDMAKFADVARANGVMNVIIDS